ncbi:MAG TPA: DUF4097 family beta strand repeat-containing protein [Longimicrobium sp.]|jgi:hypothetical protein
MRTLLATLAAAALLAPAALEAQDYRWSGRLAAGKEIEVVGVVGEIRAVAASGNTVEVVGEMRDGRLPVRVIEHEDGVTLCVVYPTRSNSRSTGRGNGSGSGRCRQEGSIVNNPPRVDFTVRVPAGVRFAGRTVQGDVRAEGMRGPVSASTVSGGVDVQTSDVAEASSVSGDVRVSMGRMPRDGSLRFSTVSGDVRLTLPADAGAELRANTVSGEIDTDFPLRMEATSRGTGWVRVGQRVRGTIGRGGPELEISTVSGDIELRRR